MKTAIHYFGSPDVRPAIGSNNGGHDEQEELVVITKTYDLILWSCNHTSRFPRQHRFVLGERLERSLYDPLETLIQAKYSRDR